MIRTGVPPPRLKLGDPMSPEACALEVQKQVDELAGELDAVKRQMKQLDSNLVQVSKEAYISWKWLDAAAGTQQHGLCTEARRGCGPGAVARSMAGLVL
ncbi:hypothetical protein BS78_04G026800 [Paspalum vaginatum]|nr:hypothetical protein BS78_04G026800 [Paspalum vaginatum]KAJ1277735.1 hypothetical protein BS78_04G026800 [Paspalum vaginatum]KAJ1277736.1 hypothetical protein BS78_04G026800 [Paspalum vaginatum]KAJ1277737.1 hypothetical protein BS78_04G026800 [Paspalum vaginatum]